MSNVAFLPGWHYTPTEEEQRRFNDLQKKMDIFRAEIDYCYKHLSDYKERKEMAHLRVRQVMGVVKRRA